MKRLFILIIIIVMSGCGRVSNSPIGIVEGYLSKYQNLSSDVMDEVDLVINDKEFDYYDRDSIKNIIKKGYSKLSYKIKDEEVIGNRGNVLVELEVLDYRSAINGSNRDNIIERLNKVRNMTRYEVEFELYKDKDVWRMKDLSIDDIKKIHGLY